MNTIRKPGRPAKGVNEKKRRRSIYLSDATLAKFGGWKSFLIWLYAAIEGVCEG